MTFFFPFISPLFFKVAFFFFFFFFKFLWLFEQIIKYS